MQDLQFSLAMIEQLKGGMATRTPYEKLREIIDALLREIPYQGYNIGSQLRLFRGRIKNSQNTLSTPNEFSYKPKSSSNSFGRCHSPGNTIFYGGSNLDTVLSELTPETGDTVHVGVARVKKNYQVTLTAIGEIDYIRRYNRALIGNEESIKTVNHLLSKFDDQTRARTLLVDAFFAELFSNPAYKQGDYKITASLAELILEAKNEKQPSILHGFAYPSVAHRGGMNFVITPEAFDKYFEWDQFMAFKITDYLGFGLYGRLQHATAKETKKDCEINWELMNI